MRPITVAILYSAATWLAVLGANIFAADLPSCADRYGRLMVNHWFTVSSLNQLERVLYYQGYLKKDSAELNRFRDLSKAVDQTEKQLDDSYRQYASLFKTQTPDGIEALSSSLARI